MASFIGFTHFPKVTWVKQAPTGVRLRMTGRVSNNDANDPNNVSYKSGEAERYMNDQNNGVPLDSYHEVSFQSAS